MPRFGGQCRSVITLRTLFPGKEDIADLLSRFAPCTQVWRTVQICVTLCTLFPDKEDIADLLSCFAHCTERGAAGVKIEKLQILVDEAAGTDSDICLQESRRDGILSHDMQLHDAHDVRAGMKMQTGKTNSCWTDVPLDGRIQILMRLCKSGTRRTKILQIFTFVSSLGSCANLRS